MSGAVRITRLDLSAGDLRQLSRKQKNPLVVRRMLAIALVLEGVDRQTAAKACGMDRQTLRDWVHHYNAEGVWPPGGALNDQTKPNAVHAIDDASVQRRALPDPFGIVRRAA